MRFLRFLLFPLSILYGLVTALRNKLYDIGLLKSSQFNIPVIVVGNLSTGGTGKTPQIEYLIRLLKNEYNLAVLSRGYKRKSKGFVLASESTTVDDLGDEPYQFAQKFNDISVSVDEDRTNGINKLLLLEKKPDVILLDDAFQHRKVKAGLNILLTTFGDLYIDDYVLPTGNLREFRVGVNRAQVVVVTKCPANLSKEKQDKIRKSLRLKENQRLYFSTVDYEDVVEGVNVKFEELTTYEVLVVTGIANPKPFLEHLESNKIKFQHLPFPDHHSFSELDLKKINEKFESIKSEKKLILTTEKDSVRLNNKLKTSHLKIKTKFLNLENDFNNTIKAYVGKSSTNR